MKFKALAAPLLSALMFVAVTAVEAAQTATGTISGRVADTHGFVVPGLTVTVQSPSLQGTRVTLTSSNGDYVFPLLPPGLYTITFELAGFAAVAEVRDLAATEPVIVDMKMQPAGVQEEVNVSGRTNMFVETVQSATNIPAATLALLPTNRTILAAVDLAAGTHPTGYLQAPTISGGMSTENVYMLNGAQITENVGNAPLSLFIEDAVQEITTTASGISAEYGRFTGGIVNAITKSGGNTLSATFRTTLTNESWRSTTPFGEPKIDQVVPTYEFTAGGPIMRDRTWFFGAGRLFDNAVTRTLSVTEIPYETRDDEERFEAKVTQALGAGQTVTVAYTNVDRYIKNQARPNPGLVMDLRSLTDYIESQNLLSARYTGALGANLFLEGQLLSRNLTVNFGSANTDRIAGTHLRDWSHGLRRYWSPIACAVCGDRQFDSTQVIAKGHYFISTARGAHNVVFGFDTFNDNSLLDNHLSGSDYWVDSTTSVSRDDVVYPVFDDSATYILYQPVLTPSTGWNFRTHSLFLADTLRYNDRFTFNLGLRWDKNDGSDASGTQVSTGSSFSPRLGVVWDLSGDGRWAVSAGFSRYVGAVDGAVANLASPAGRPAQFVWRYGGPAVNVNSSGPLVTPDQALRTLFNWFDSVGGTNLRPYAATPLIPGFTTVIEGSVDSPTVVEYTGGLSRRLGARGALRADVVYRDHRDFYAVVTNPSTGKVTNSLGQTFDLSLIENANAEMRRYAGLTVQSNYRLSDRLDIAGNYTVSRLWSTFGVDGPIATNILSFPEYKESRWTAPEGDHPSDQRHRARLWSTYRLPGQERIGSFTVSAIERIDSGTPYGASGPINSRPFVANPGYVNPPFPVGYFFTARDEFRTETVVRTDLALNYTYKLAARRPELFAQAQLLNAFNHLELVDTYSGFRNLDILTQFNAQARYQAFNPFTTEPVRGVHWDYSPNFGKALEAGAYNLPRTFLITFGIRY